MALQIGACDPWETRLCCDVDQVDADDVAFWTRVASNILWAMSGRRFGPCPITVRPCRKSCMDSYPYPMQWGYAAGPWIPYIGRDGLWRNASVCGCATDCSCTELCEVQLPGPVYEITEVTLDGVVLPAEAYRVDAPNMLVRTDGDCWPDCQDMAANPGEENTFTVAYQIGLPLDEAAIAAVSELTCHLIKGCQPGTCGCKTNRNLTRVTRQGVELELPDPGVIYAQGRTGLPLVDLWLAAVNPYRLTSASRVLSPDYKLPRVQQWP